MFPLMPAAAGRHGNTAAMSLQMVYRGGCCLSARLSTFAHHRGHSDYWYSTPQCHDSCASLFLQSGTKRAGWCTCTRTRHADNCVHLEQFKHPSILKSTGLSAHKGFALMPCYLSWHDRCAPHCAVLVSEQLSSCWPALLIWAVSTHYIR